MSIERSLQLYKGLAEVSALLVAITDFTELLSAILEVARRVMGAEASSLFLVDEHGDLRLTLASGGPETNLPPVILPRGRGIAGWALEHRQSLLVPDAYADPRFFRQADVQAGFKTRSVLCAPLFKEEADIGVLEVLNPNGKPAFEPADLEAFEAFANLVATAIDKIRALDREREQALVEHELRLAHDIQSSFLPQSLPSRDGLVFAANYRPARNIGGDFYDVLEAGPDEVFFVLGDVSGKGIPAALLMAQALSLLRLIVEPGSAPAAVLRRWNELLHGRTIEGMFITAVLGRIALSSREVRIATAGHCNPVFIRPGSAGEIRLKGAPPLGVLALCEPEENRVSLAPGDFLLLYTDGLTESTDAEGRMLDREGVLAALEGRRFPSASEVVFTLTERENRHRNGAEPHDDMTLLAFGFR